MYLSKIELFGFKSFAGKTNIVLNDGVTAIVGPNGCGKTNIVDALRWALGEQRYSTLRSDKMEDVIFNGSKQRKPIGMAEVSLTITNNKGILPLEYNEVTVTRRVYRSGESEYLLNRTNCRLKDILGLFMDTGMGANAYSVIELKMIETILSDKVEERRRLFEEAAGVTKYKARRKEALRKLVDVDSDLLRVDDIITEVSKTVNSLNRQAKKAERYNEYMERLRMLEVDVLQRDYVNLFRRLAPLEERLLATIDQRNSMSKRMEEEETLLEVHRSEANDIEHRLEIRRNEHAVLSGRMNETRQSLLVNEERERSLLQRAERLKDDKQGYESRITDIIERKEVLTRDLESRIVELGGLEAESASLRNAHQDVEEQLSEKRLQTESRQQRRLELMQDTTQLKNEIERVDGRKETIDGMIARIDSEDGEVSKALATLRSEMAEQDVGQSLLSETVLDAEREFQLMEERKQSLRNEI
ncbi:MAG: AAA family ATPase, partial [Bacteroidetes bacterium]|nr:AAA family ATPase [Bacteroidota bacterium]